MTSPNPNGQIQKPTHRDVLHRIRACENSAEGRALLSDAGFAEIYPLVRQRLMSDNFSAIKATSAAFGGWTVVKKLCAMLVHERFGLTKLPAGPNALAMLSYTTSRLFRLPDGWPDAYVEPFLSALEMKGEHGVVLEVPARGEYRLPAIRQGHLVGLDELRARAVAALKSQAAMQAEAVASFARIAFAQGLVTVSLSPKNWKRAWNIFLQRRKIFEMQLKRAAPEVALVVTWYGTTGMAFTSAAQRIGIVVADIQHGVQGQDHSMYGAWPTEALKSSFLPTAFFVWSEVEARHLNSWIGERRQSYVCGVPWLQIKPSLLTTSTDARILMCAANGNPVILVSLQPDPAAVLDYVAEALKLPGASDYAWALRCHPGHTDQIEMIASKFSGFKNVLPVRESTLAPLIVLLRQSVCHLTEFSSVVLEASACGIPSYLISSFGRNLFAHLDETRVKVAERPDELLRLIAATKEPPTVPIVGSAIQNGKAGSALEMFRYDMRRGALGHIPARHV